MVRSLQRWQDRVGKNFNFAGEGYPFSVQNGFHLIDWALSCLSSERSWNCMKIPDVKGQPYIEELQRSFVRQGVICFGIWKLNMFSRSWAWMLDVGLTVLTHGDCLKTLFGNGVMASWTKCFLRLWAEAPHCIGWSFCAVCGHCMSGRGERNVKNFFEGVRR